ncbi:hypothetical protein LA080_010233 [Diaporthe eres]|nr:hypothetical protein LA080_010233 [Diaporthe eres]
MAGLGRAFDDETAASAAALRTKMGNGPTPQRNIQQRQADGAQQAQPQPNEQDHVPDAITNREQDLVAEERELPIELERELAIKKE